MDPTTVSSDVSASVVVPAQFSECAPVAVGTGVWALLFVIGLFIRPDLVESGREWWVWSAAAGIFLGLFGYAYLRRRQNRLLARAAAMTPATPVPVEPAVEQQRTPDRS